MNVKVIRMNTGEEVIVTLLEDKEESILIDNAMVGVTTGDLVKLDLDPGNASCQEW